jgi:hypothetical protein
MVFAQRNGELMAAPLAGAEQMMDVQFIARDVKTQYIALAATNASNLPELLETSSVNLGDPDSMFVEHQASAN